MPVKCYIKPNRKFARRFTTSDVARITCDLMRDGSISQSTIEAELVERGCWQELDADAPCDKERKAMQQAANVVAENLNLLGQVESVLNAVLIALGIIVAIGLFFAPARPASLAAARVRTSIAVLTVRIGVQRAANQSMYNILRAAA